MSLIKSLSISAILIVSVFLLSCGENKHYTAYQCPMKCEAEKTYNKEGKCPVCGMDLEGVEAKK